MLANAGLWRRLLRHSAFSSATHPSPARRSFFLHAAKKDSAASTKGTRKRRSKAKTETAPATGADRPEKDLGKANLRRCTPSGAHWQAVERWVLFSDLHVSYKTLSVCCEVLDRVKAEAAARNAGIIFLGDFWHQRGALPVPPLNAVLDKFRDWPFPTIMLVGNHDQVNFEGSEHGVTPLAAACPAMHIMEVPTLFLGALWLPYRRDHEELKEAMRAAGPVGVLFAHADVVGASVNETYQAREGLQPDEFPASVDIYTGHYHKPHTVPGTTIHYVGSPYQVSRSEATQQKRFLVLDSSWSLVDTVPLDIGPRHFNVQATDGEPAPLPDDLRAGDSIRWTVPSIEQQPEAEEAVQALKDQGVEVEVVMKAPDAVRRIEQAESLGALELLHAYAASTAMGPPALQEASSILQDIGQTGSQLRAEGVNLELHRLSLSGYGPFRDEVSYDLGQRGLRVITGKNNDDPASDSNGAGKSALVMAPLWAITGRTEPRSEGGSVRGLTHSDIVNDNAKTVWVRVEGVVNQQPFAVERSASRRGLSSLKFQLNGEDKTGQESKITQRLIDEHLCAQLLPQAVFHTQTDIAGLLEANDRAFKEELGQLVELEVWESAQEVAADRLKRTRRQQEQVAWGMQGQQERLQDYSRKAEQAQARQQQWEEQRAARRGQLENAESASSRQLQQYVHQLAQVDAQLERSFLAATSALEASQQHEDDSMPDQDELAAVLSDSSRSGELRVQVADLRQHVQQYTQQLLEQQSLLGQARAVYQEQQKTLHEYSTLANSNRHHHYVDEDEGLSRLSDASSSNGAPVVAAGRQPVCDRCLQPIDAQLFQENVARMRAGMAAAKLKYDSAQGSIHATQGEISRVNQEAGEVQGRADAAEREERAAADANRRAHLARERAASERKQLTIRAEAKVQSVRNAKDRCRRVLNEHLPLVAQLPELPQHEQPLLPAGTDVLLSVDRFNDAVRQAASSLARAQHQLATFAQEANPHELEVSQMQGLMTQAHGAVEAAKAEAAALEAEVAWRSVVDKAFGRGGIQSFALEGLLQELQARTGLYLEQLSTGHTLTLSATRPASGRGASQQEVERITKTVHVRTGTAEGGYDMRTRSVKQLSGGERRRIALGLALAFGDLAAARGRLQCNLMVLDEVLQQLDGEGCARVCAALKAMPQASVLVVAQAKSYATQEFDAVDVVVKEGGHSRIVSN